MLPPLVASQAKLRAEFGCIGSIWQKSYSSAGMLFSCASNVAFGWAPEDSQPKRGHDEVAGDPGPAPRARALAFRSAASPPPRHAPVRSGPCACRARTAQLLGLRALPRQFRGGSSRGATPLLPTFSSYEHELWAVRHASGLLFPKKRLARSPTLSQRIDRLSFVLIIRFISQSAITAPRPIPDRDREHARTSNALCICANFNAFEREFCRDVVCAVRERSAVSAPIAGFERSRRRVTALRRSC